MHKPMPRDIDRVWEIIAEVKPLAAEFYRLTGKPLGVTGEIAEFIAAAELDLVLAAPRTPGYDATREGPNGIERVQIKGRAYPKGADKGQRIGKINVDAECDMVLFVLLNPATLDLREIWEAPFKAVTDRLASCTSKAHARSTLGVPEFKRIAQKIWPPKSSKRLPDA